MKKILVLLLLLLFIPIAQASYEPITIGVSDNVTITVDGTPYTCQTPTCTIMINTTPYKDCPIIPCKFDATDIQDELNNVANECSLKNSSNVLNDTWFVDTFSGLMTNITEKQVAIGNMDDWAWMTETMLPSHENMTNCTIDLENCKGEKRTLMDDVNLKQREVGIYEIQLESVNRQATLFMFFLMVGWSLVVILFYQSKGKSIPFVGKRFGK